MLIRITRHKKIDMPCTKRSLSIYSGWHIKGMSKQEPQKVKRITDEARREEQDRKL